MTPRSLTIATAMLVVALVGARVVAAQLPGTRVPGGCDVPAAQRTSEFGCFLSATEALEALPAGEIFWHVSVYPTREAAQRAKPPAGTVVESFGKVWLFVIANAQWRPAAGERAAAIGPLPVTPAKQYTARYMEAVFPANGSMQTAVHRHSGVEAWLVLTGAQCLRTPDDTMLIRAGQSGFVRSGPPMVLTNVGSDTRRSLVLVLHDASQPWMTVADDWTPTTTCPN